VSGRHMSTVSGRHGPIEIFAVADLGAWLSTPAV